MAPKVKGLLFCDGIGQSADLQGRVKAARLAYRRKFGIDADEVFVNDREAAGYLLDEDVKRVSWVSPAHCLASGPAEIRERG